MTLQLPNLGTAANDGTGDPIRTALSKLAANDTELYAGAATVNVRTLGAKLDGVQRIDGAMTAGSAVLNSASSAFTAADVGKTIVVNGAAASGGALVTTIASVQSGTQATLAVAASTAVTGTQTVALAAGWFIYGTDDTAAWQAAINALTAAGGGKVKAPAGISVIAGALKTTGNCNAQITFPTNTAPQAPLAYEIEGVCAPPSPAFWSEPPPTAGTILFSTLAATTGTRPTCFGPPQTVTVQSGGHTNFTELRVLFRNLTFRSVYQTGVGLVDGTTMAALDLRDVYLDKLISIDTQTAVPNTLTDVGFYMSGRGSQCDWAIENVYVVGYCFGCQAGEGGWVNNLFVFACQVAMALSVVDYPTTFGAMIVSWCQIGCSWKGYNGLSNGRHDAHFMRYLTEHWTASVGHGASWMGTAYDFNDATTNNYSHGQATFYEVDAAVGVQNKLLLNGCAGARFTCGSQANVSFQNGITATTIPNNSTWTQVGSAICGVDGGGDYAVQISMELVLNAVVGPVTVLGRLVDSNGNQIANTVFTMHSDGSTSAITRTVRVSDQFVLRKSGTGEPYGTTQFRFQAQCSYASGTSVSISASSASAAGSLMTTRPA